MSLDDSVNFEGSDEQLVIETDFYNQVVKEKLMKNYNIPEEDYTNVISYIFNVGKAIDLGDVKTILNNKEKLLNRLKK